jgi:hypothetical protein
MSATGRPEREYRSAQREGTPMSAAGEAKTRRVRRHAIGHTADMTTYHYFVLAAEAA